MIVPGHENNNNQGRAVGYAKIEALKVNGGGMKYWWVNHKQTAKQEISEGFLWSPVTKANGARNLFYDNMRLAKPGELVVSYADGKISHVGTVQDFAVPATKPTSFGATGDYWAADGWLLSIEWEKLPTPVLPRQMLEELRPLLPTKYSPLNAENGHGNQVAYLAEVSGEVFRLLLGDAILAKVGNGGSMSGAVIEAVEEQVEQRIQSDKTLAETQKKQLVLARRGQGDFRSNVMALANSCRLTGLSNPSLLVASHIKPWRVCISADERLNGANGLMLAPHVDRLFDKGYISFEDDGRVLLSPQLSQDDLTKLGLAQCCAQGTSSFNPDQAQFLAYHRTHVFLRQA